jgi:hypothetical protein
MAHGCDVLRQAAHVYAAAADGAVHALSAAFGAAGGATLEMVATARAA